MRLIRTGYKFPKRVRKKMSEKAKGRDMSNLLSIGTAAALSKYKASPEDFHEAKTWEVITPENKLVIVKNLTNWLCRRLGKNEGPRVERLLNTMAAHMRKGLPAWVTRCGWSLERPAYSSAAEPLKTEH